MDESLYSRVGGRAFFEQLIARFYAGVASDPLLRPLYPDDLAAAEGRLTAFVVQYFGGPADYSAARGAPRLRMRHMEFPIDAAAAAAWTAQMDAALDAAQGEDALIEEMRGYFHATARFLVNRGGLSIAGSS
jgi:hemoglobin